MKVNGTILILASSTLRDWYLAGSIFSVGMQDKIRPDGKSYMSGRSKTRYAAYF